jgi:hypothetical protein
MKKGLWITSIIGSILGGLVAVLGLAISNNADQEVVATTLGIALAVIPSCLARAVSEAGK